jgi:hypothetical protein
VDRRVPLDQSNIPAAKAELTLDKTLPPDNKSLFDTIPSLDPFLWLPRGISSVSAKRTGKKQGKGTVNSGDGFAKVANGGCRKAFCEDLAKTSMS